MKPDYQNLFHDCPSRIQARSTDTVKLTVGASKMCENLRPADIDALQTGSEQQQHATFRTLPAIAAESDGRVSRAEED